MREDLIERLRSVKWEVADDGDRMPDDPAAKCVFVDMRPDDFRALLREAADALEAARAEVGNVTADLMESDEIREKLRHLLTRTAAALKGEPPAGVWHSWHDLPERAALATARADRLAWALKKVAQSLEWYAHGRCRGFDDEAPLLTNEAVELAERTLAEVRGHDDSATKGGQCVVTYPEQP